VSKRLLTLATICFAVSACDQLPEFPSVKTDLVDARNGKIHRYELPKARGKGPTQLGSRPLDPTSIDKSFCFAPREYAKIENYISAVEDIAQQRCR
jgi:hypothetical protein